MDAWTPATSRHGRWRRRCVCTVPRGVAGACLRLGPGAGEIYAYMRDPWGLGALFVLCGLASGVVSRLWWTYVLVLGSIC